MIFENLLTIQTDQKAESRTTRSLLMQDWAFRLGSAWNSEMIIIIMVTAVWSEWWMLLKLTCHFFLPVACYNSLKFCTYDAIFYATLIYIRITSELTKACIIKVVKGCRPLYWTQRSTQLLEKNGSNKYILDIIAA